MEGYRGSSSSNSSSSNDSGHPDVSSSSGWSVRPVKGEEVQEDTLGGGAVPSSTSDTSSSSSSTSDKSPTLKAQAPSFEKLNTRVEQRAVYTGCPRIIETDLLGGRGHQKDSKLSATHSQKRLSSELGGVVYKSIEGNGPALP
ncbi:hypothetical protein TNCV_1899511 [Trichonephila clavipes]|nr:hypothetical protein TNCV_1899511 [Trichonephila clavipes]